MASIRKRGDLQWEVRIRKKGYPLQVKTFESNDDAKLWAATIESEMGRGVFVSRSEAERTTLYSALERYLEEITPGKDGAAIEATRIKVWQRHPLALRSLARLTSADFSTYRNERLAKGIATSTIKKELAIISNLYTVSGTDWNMVLPNPIKYVSIKQEDNSRDRRLMKSEPADELEDEEVRLFKAMENPNGEGSNIWMLPLTQFAIETAARQSELLRLEWTDVNLNKRTARIKGKERVKIIKNKKVKGEDHLKNGEKYRDIPLSSRAVEILSTLPRSISGKVFPTTSSAVKQSFVRACRRAKIKDLTFHDLRHEATSRLAEIFQLHELTVVSG